MAIFLWYWVIFKENKTKKPLSLRGSLVLCGPTYNCLILSGPANCQIFINLENTLKKNKICCMLSREFRVDTHGVSCPTGSKNLERTLTKVPFDSMVSHLSCMPVCEKIYPCRNFLALTPSSNL